MLEKYEDLVSRGTRLVSPENASALDDPKRHHQLWHQHSVLEHCKLVCLAAFIIQDRTGIAATVAAAYHDLGKFAMFDEVMAGRLQPFEGHEDRSADLAAEDGIPAAAVFAIRNHDAAYRKEIGFDPAKFAALAEGDCERLTQLVALCAADAAGKGWAPGQRRQRPKIARLLRAVAREHLGNQPLAEVAFAAARFW